MAKEVEEFKLTPEQKKRLAGLEGDIISVKSRLTKLSNLGIDTSNLQAMLDSAEAMRKGLLEQFGAKG